MNGKHLLDTNIIVALFKNDDNVRNQIAAAAEVFVPAIEPSDDDRGSRPPL
jgi:predicted nucleic acid-binding protein